MFINKQIIVLFLVTFIFILFLLRRIKFFEIYAFFVPFFGIDGDIGVRYTISLLILFLANISFFVNLILRKNNLKYLLFFNISILLFLLYTNFSNVLLSNFVLEFYPTLNPGFLRNEGRYISQFLMYSLLFSIFYVTPFFVKEYSNFINVIKWFLKGIIVLAIIGIIQQIVFVITGHNIIELRPLGGLHGVHIHTTFGIPLMRINSLAGEPKSLGMYMVVGIVLIRTLDNLNIKVLKYQTYLIILFFIVLIMSLSSSGFVMLPILFFISELLSLFFKRKYMGLSLNKLILTITLLFLIAIFYKPIKDIIMKRTIERGIEEDYDMVALEGWKNNPEYWLTGCGLGNMRSLSYPHLWKFNFPYIEEQLIFAKSGYLRILTETGIIGFLFFLSFNFLIFFKIFKTILIEPNENYKKMFSLLLILSLSFFVGYLLRSYIIEVYLLFLALANTFYKLFNKNEKNVLMQFL